MVWLVAVAFGAFTLGFVLAALLGGAGVATPPEEVGGAAAGRTARCYPPAGSPIGGPGRVAPSRSAGGLAHG